MEKKNQPLTREQIHNFTKPLLEEMVFGMQGQIAEMNSKLSELTERINVLLEAQYGRKTEKTEQPDHQMVFCFNEAEVTIVDASELQLREPSITDINPLQDEDGSGEEKPSGKPHPKQTKAGKLKALPQTEVSYQLSEEQQKCACGGTYKEIGKTTVTRLEFHPASFEVVRQIIYSYKCDSCGQIIRADHPLPLFEGSLATPSLLAGIMTAKYTNAMTFYRLEEAFSGNNALLTRQTMARWMIRAAEVYFSPLFDRLKQELLSSDIIHADETTVNVAKDERPAGAKSYLWNYTKEGDDRPIVLFEIPEDPGTLAREGVPEGFHRVALL